MLGPLLDFSKPYLFSNMQYWFEREFMFYPKADFDLAKELKPLKEKLMPICGELSPKDAYQYRAMEVASEELGLSYISFLGEHVGHATHTPEFAGRLLEELRNKDQF